MLGLLRRNEWLVLAALVVLNLLSLADWALTLNALNSGAAEANPILAGLLGQGAALAGLFKVALMLGVSILIWRARSFRLVLGTLVAAIGLYLAVIVYHIAAPVFVSVI